MRPDPKRGGMLTRQTSLVLPCIEVNIVTPEILPKPGAIVIGSLIFLRFSFPLFSSRTQSQPCFVRLRVWLRLIPPPLAPPPSRPAWLMRLLRLERMCCPRPDTFRTYGNRLSSPPAPP